MFKFQDGGSLYPDAIYVKRACDDLLFQTLMRGESVSYTHLDVYKRQQLDPLSLEPRAGTARNWEHPTE